MRRVDGILSKWGGTGRVHYYLDVARVVMPTDDEQNGVNNQAVVVEFSSRVA
jgi:hypothetical protein